MNGCEVDMSEQEPVLEQCDYMHLHEKVIEQVQEEMPEEEILYDLAELFKVFWRFYQNQNSVRVVSVRNVCMRYCAAFEYESVRHISSIAGTSSKRSLLSTAERENSILSLADAHVNTILNQGLEHIEE